MKSSAAGRVYLLDIFNVAHQIFKTRKFKEGPLCPHDGRSWSQKNASVFFLKLSITGHYRWIVSQKFVFDRKVQGYVFFYVFLFLIFQFYLHISHFATDDRLMTMQNIYIQRNLCSVLEC